MMKTKVIFQKCSFHIKNYHCYINEKREYFTVANKYLEISYKTLNNNYNIGFGKYMLRNGTRIPLQFKKILMDFEEHG